MNGWMFAAVFAAGAGAISFASEQESGTVELLRALPISKRELVVGKLAPPIVAILSMQLLTCLLEMGLVFFGDGVMVVPERAMYATWGLAAFEVLGWGVFWSLRTRGTLQAALLTAFTAAFVIQLTVAAVAERPWTVGSVQDYLGAIPARLAVLAALMVANIRQVPHWLDQTKRGQTFSAAGNLSSRIRSEALRKPLPPAALGQWYSLTWETLRVAMPIVAAIAVAELAWIGFLVWMQNVPLRETEPTTFLTGLPMIGLACGLFTFRFDQPARARSFLVDHGISPSLIWLTRLSVWGASSVILLGTVAASVVARSEALSPTAQFEPIVGLSLTKALFSFAKALKLSRNPQRCQVKLERFIQVPFALLKFSGLG